MTKAVCAVLASESHSFSPTPRFSAVTSRAPRNIPITEASAVAASVTRAPIATMSAKRAAAVSVGITAVNTLITAASAPSWCSARRLDAVLACADSERTAKAAAVAVQRSSGPYETAPRPIAATPIAIERTTLQRVTTVRARTCVSPSYLDATNIATEGASMAPKVHHAGSTGAMARVAKVVAAVAASGTKWSAPP